MKRIATICFFAILFSFFSCDENVKVAGENTNGNYAVTFGKGVKTDIGTTGFTIDLPATHKMEKQQGPDFTVFYITSIDTTINKGAAGIYFGPAPDEHGPQSAISQKESNGMTLGKTSKTVEYTTPTYTWIETIVDESDSTKIQIWYFAYNNAELLKLGEMINTITRK